MKRFLAPYAEHTYAALRFVVGAMFACHGAQKIFGVLGGTVTTDSFMFFGGLLELAGALVAIGLATSTVAFILSGEMAVAYFKFHASGGFWPIVNHGESAVLYCFAFLYIACRGGGPFSLDGLIAKRRSTA